MASTFNLSIYAGETRTLAVTVTDQDGAAVDLTNADIEYVADLPVPVAKSVGSGITITDGAAGEFEIAIEQPDTVDYDTSINAAHEVKARTAIGDVVTVFRGTLTIKDSLIESLPLAP